nr:hypothetical protein [Tanacetum cinerariifolium]
YEATDLWVISKLAGHEILEFLEDLSILSVGYPTLFIKFGDSYKAPQKESDKDPTSESSTKKKGRVVVITTEDMQKRRNDVKARTTLLLALLDEHQLRFGKYETTKELWEAILKTFGGNEATKKTKKNQLKQQYSNFKAEGSETLEQTFNRLQAIIKYEDISQIDEDDIEEIDIKWNMALLSMMADRFWKKTGKKISIQSTDVAGFDKSKVDASIATRWAFLLGSAEHLGVKTEVEEKATNKKNTKSLNSKISKLNEELSDSENNLYHYKLGLSQVEARLVEFKTQEIKFCEKIRGLKKDVEEVKELIRTRRVLDTVQSPPPLPTQVYLPPKKDMSWTGLPEFADDTVTDYSRPTPSIDSSKSNTSDLQKSNSSVPEHGESSDSIMSKPIIKFIKAANSPKVEKGKSWPKKNFAHKNVTPKAVLLKTGRTPLANNIDDKRYWDSGCSRHMTGNISYLSEYEPYDEGYVSFGQEGGKITSKGIIKTGKLEFENVYFVKEVKYNLFSVSQICDNKNSVLFTDSECIVLGKDFKLKDDTNVLLRTPRRYNIYFIDLNNVVPHKNLTCLVAKASVDESMLWHRRLGHLNFKTMNKLVRNNLVKGLPFKCFENDHTCVACLKGKQHKASCKTKFTWTFFLRTKDETSGILRNFITQIENLKDLKVKIIRNRTLIEAARTMLADAKLSVTFWAEAVNTAYYVQNRVLVNKPHNKTPYDLFNSRTPAIGFLRPFRCHVMILNTLDHLGKFDAKEGEGYFVGYSMSSKAFRVFNKRTKKVEENLHVDLLENKLIKKGAGPNWLFDIDTLTISMNYVPVVNAGTSSTNISGTKDVASQAVKKDVSSLRYIM